MRSLRAPSFGWVSAAQFLCSSAALSLRAQERTETKLRVDVVDALPVSQTGDVVEWTLPVAPPAPAFVPVDVEIVLVSRLEPCFSDPPLCSGGEDAFDEEREVHGCADGIDNDGDGRIDAEELECSRGVTGWSFSVATDPCFGGAAATTRGTVGDLDLRPPGLRDSEGGSFEKTAGALTPTTPRAPRRARSRRPRCSRTSR